MLDVTYTKDRSGVTVEGVFIEWPFIAEALENAEEVEADRIQDALEQCLMGYEEHPIISEEERYRLAVLGNEVLNQVKKYIEEEREIKNG